MACRRHFNKGCGEFAQCKECPTEVKAPRHLKYRVLRSIRMLCPYACIELNNLKKVLQQLPKDYWCRGEFHQKVLGNGQVALVTHTEAGKEIALAIFLP